MKYGRTYNFSAGPAMMPEEVLEEIAAEIEAITDTIKREMTAQGVDMLAGDDWKATWKQVQSARFDSRAFKVAMPDLYERFTRSAETRRFVLA